MYGALGEITRAIHALAPSGPHWRAFKIVPDDFVERSPHLTPNPPHIKKPA